MAQTCDKNNKIICNRQPTDTLESDRANHYHAPGTTNAPHQIPSDINGDPGSSDPVIRKSPTHGNYLDKRDKLVPPDITNNRKFDKTFDVKLRTQQNTEQ